MTFRMTRSSCGKRFSKDRKAFLRVAHLNEEEWAFITMGRWTNKGDLKGLVRKTFLPGPNMEGYVTMGSSKVSAGGKNGFMEC